jgi:TetR/AcrR family transcriptional repressor of nem operon
MVQEVYSAHPAIQSACRDSIFGHAKTLEPTISEIKRKYIPKAKWTSESLALYIQSSIQGGFILAKVDGDVKSAVLCQEHLERYIRLLFSKPH